MKEPRISIVIPVYNGSNFMRDAINCALNQTYQNIEVIVVNDGSNDGGATEQVALSYGDKIRYFHKENGGVSSALNYGINKMTGDYMVWLSHDDMFSLTRIEDAVNLMKTHDMLGQKCIGFTGGYIMDAGGSKISDFRKCFETDRIYTGLEVVESLTNYGTLYGCCFLFPRNVFDEIGGFDESLRYSQDALMWYRIFLSDYRLITDNRPNVMSRMHGAQVSHTRRNLFRHDALVIAKLLAEPLAKAEPSGGLLMRYIKRQTRYECTEAIRFLCEYAEANGYMTFVNRTKIGLYRIVGFFRYHVVTCGKRVLIRFRHR